MACFSTGKASSASAVSDSERLRLVETRRAPEGAGQPVGAWLSECGSAAADVYFGRQYAVLSERAKIKRLTMLQRRKDDLAEKAA